MSWLRAGLIVAFGMLLAGCTAPQLFPTDAMRDVDPSFDFAAWRAAPTKFVGRSVQLGGRILQAEARKDGVMIVGMEMPIMEHPVYGPKDIGKRTGEFAFFYPGRLEPNALRVGNRFIVVGTTEKVRSIQVEDIPPSDLFLLARCVHIWKTEGREISEFPYIGADYYPLEEDTYCTSAMSP
jgi:starvation-inducible outer membrane lipoprotein